MYLRTYVFVILHAFSMQVHEYTHITNNNAL